MRLLRLLRWREAHARRADRPRSWILDNELAVLLARDPGPDLPALQRQFDTHPKAPRKRSEEHTSELQSLMRNSYAVFCLKKKKKQYKKPTTLTSTAQTVTTTQKL